MPNNTLNACGRLVNYMRTGTGISCQLLSTISTQSIQKLKTHMDNYNLYATFTHMSTAAINNQIEASNHCYNHGYPHNPQDLLLSLTHKKIK